ncbi:phage tail protein [Desulfovibrio subterraneus]|uniref:phage tail protein n=1 Tax=Desulfovibrio subterraneus TaxID=2718620 RepID=UPI0022B89A66|nr:phage tail protein [Desulfovibrio subterraneus]WBF68263.1 phage tail protein [Desulfovibrio subterraneus]
MRKLRALTTFLMQATGLPRESFDAFVDSGELNPTGKDLGHGIEVARFRYDASVYLYNYAGDGHQILALVMAWVVGHDAERELHDLSDPKVEVTILDDDSADVEIRISFDEGVELVMDPQGRIPYGGAMWSVTDVPVDVAEAVERMDGEAQEAGADG